MPELKFECRAYREFGEKSVIAIPYGREKQSFEKSSIKLRD
jgi:hypothetical protein